MLDAAVRVLLLEDLDLDLDLELDSMTEFNSSLETSEPMLDVDVVEVSIVVQLSLLEPLGLLLLLSSGFLLSKENDSEMAPS